MQFPAYSDFTQSSLPFVVIQESHSSVFQRPIHRKPDEARNSNLWFTNRRPHLLDGEVHGPGRLTDLLRIAFAFTLR